MASESESSAPPPEPPAAADGPVRCEVVAAEPTMRTHSFEVDLMDRQLACTVFDMNETIYVWIGESMESGPMGGLVVAMQTRFGAMPLASEVFGAEADAATPMAQRLAALLGRHVYVSLNLPRSDPQLIPFVEERVATALRERFSPQ